MGYYSNNELEEQLKLANPNLDNLSADEFEVKDDGSNQLTSQQCYKCGVNGHPIGMSLAPAGYIVSGPNKDDCPPGWFTWAEFNLMDPCPNQGVAPDYGPCGTAPDLQSMVRPQGGDTGHAVKVDAFFKNMKEKYNQGNGEIKESGEKGIKEGSCGYTETPEGQKLPTPGGTKGMSADDRTKSMMKNLIQKEIKKWKEKKR